MTMRIYVNGEPTELTEGVTAELLLSRLGLAGKRLAVEVNAQIVPRSTYPTRQLKDGDRVEIVQAIGGG
jgi:thiamine biosynthesis protein ThiS